MLDWNRLITARKEKQINYKVVIFTTIKLVMIAHYLTKGGLSTLDWSTKRGHLPGNFQRLVDYPMMAF